MTARGNDDSAALARIARECDGDGDPDKARHRSPTGASMRHARLRALARAKRDGTIPRIRRGASPFQALRLHRWIGAADDVAGDDAAVEAFGLWGSWDDPTAADTAYCRRLRQDFFATLGDFGRAIDDYIDCISGPISDDEGGGPAPGGILPQDGDTSGGPTPAPGPMADPCDALMNEADLLSEQLSRLEDELERSCGPLQS
ncbi:hypothetical protein MWU52_10680 [Jannaschia sp. S6380]|uniref:hypothetical protein n=1 Tax=Jannaschia sp. S6380 TaxID=2926408 RepID=UPI001FF52D9A|nr:hypothetical protein [Jannaschia sp. S6380]MCK0168016.1 hypothetical protein [Jannaschia sp. S6380]